MGIDMGDYDGDGLLDIVVTNYELETNGLYRNLGGGTFVDSRSPAGIAEPSLLYLAFGVAFADFDQDGDLDLVIADGNINPNAPDFLEGSTYAQRNLVFENLGTGKFREDKATGMDGVRVHRGLAVGDLDGDGDLDVALNNLNEPCEVYENVSGRRPLAAGRFRRARRQPLRHRRPGGAGGGGAQEADPRREGRLLLRLPERPRRPLRAGQGREGGPPHGEAAGEGAGVRGAAGGPEDGDRVSGAVQTRLERL